MTVVDAGGRLLAHMRMDGARLGSVARHRQGAYQRAVPPSHRRPCP
ncbi:hypothetical protein [Streptomyces reniochalinae]